MAVRVPSASELCLASRGKTTGLFLVMFPTSAVTAYRSEKFVVPSGSVDADVRGAADSIHDTLFLAVS
ncbi:MAG: hypothetical protein AW12_00867 [Candidatus Accumulibacter sp. BA-94]|nr:MAG: hypothetical protein AW12_00867 [Candidatus Accumulibacter sp. BA-94]